MDRDRTRLKFYLLVFAALLMTGIAGFMLVENLSLVDSLYFAIVTMATVGYGDIHPQSSVGKVLALILIIGGVGTFLGIIATVTDLLRAIFHLRDELLNRTDLAQLPDSDRTHLEGDIVRIYKLLAFEWLAYMRYLKNNYSYLFSLAMRVNPFDPQASAVVTDS